MNPTAEHNEKLAKMTIDKIYPCYVNKIEKKGRTIQELNQAITQLTGFNDGDLEAMINQKVSFKTFFEKVKLNPNAHMIKGSICGYRIEEIDNPLTKQIRYLDKLVDELAKGKKMEKILRK